MNDSGEFQEKESNYNVTFSHRSQSKRQSFQVLDHVEPRPTCHLIRGKCLGTGKRFWQSSFYVRFITDTFSRNSSLYDGSKGQPVARGEERIGAHNTNADDCRKAVNHEFLFASGNSTEFYGCTAKTANILELQVGKFPHLQCYSCWKIRFKTKVSSCSDFPSDAT